METWWICRTQKSLSLSKFSRANLWCQVQKSASRPWHLGWYSCIAVVSKDELSPLRVLDSWAILPGSYNCHSSLRSARSARSARSVQTRATSATSLLSFSKDFRGGGQKQVYLEVMETVKLECSESHHLHDIRFFLCLLLLSQNFLPSRLWSHLAWTESLFFSWSLVP